MDYEIFYPFCNRCFKLSIFRSKYIYKGNKVLYNLGFQKKFAVEKKKEIFQDCTSMNSIQAKKIPLANVLSFWHIPAVKSVGNDIWYKSPLRPKEKTASFKINQLANVWYDHGMGKGGNIIDLVMLRENCSMKEALKILSQLGKPKISPVRVVNQLELPSIAKTPKIALKRQKKLEYGVLLDYLQSRKINTSIAQQYLQEVFYSKSGEEKTYFGLAFGNDEGGTEIRNKYFKGCLGTKAITTLVSEETNPQRVFVFEGFIDFLSYLTLKKVRQLRGHVIVLNSIALKEQALEKIQTLEPKSIEGFLDNDEGGKATSAFFSDHLENFTSWGYKFLPFKDINEYLCNRK